MTAPELDLQRQGAEEGAADAVTFAWADPGTQLYGLARLGLGGAADAATATALAVLFRQQRSVAGLARGGVEAGGAGWDDLSVAGLRAAVVEPLSNWSLSYDGDDAAWDLRFEALSPPAALPADAPPAQAAGIRGYDQLCRVRGTVRADGREQRVDCLGQRARQWGAPDWAGIELARTLGAWLDPKHAVVLTSIRPAGAAGHDEEAAWAALLEEGGVIGVDEPRLSTTYDGEGHQRRAGLELWIAGADGEETCRRAAGEVVCGSTLALGPLRLQCAFFRWHMEGREGWGRYDVLRRA